MASIINAITGNFDRDVCASDDCISTTGESDSNFVAPLFDIAIGKLKLYS